MKRSQNDQILHYLKTHKRGITPLEAMRKFGCMRLSGRIYELKDRGHNISTSIVEVTNQNGDICRVARYRLIEKS